MVLLIREFESSKIVYKGEYKNNKKDGYGELKWKKGGMYIGTFKEGKRHGYGEYKDENGILYKGKWENGELVEPIKSKTI